MLLGAILISKSTAFNLKATLLAELFYLRHDDAGGYTNFQTGVIGSLKHGRQIKHMTERFRHVLMAKKRVPQRYKFCGHCVTKYACINRYQIRKYKKYLDMTEQCLIKELDLDKFLHR